MHASPFKVKSFAQQNNSTLYAHIYLSHVIHSLDIHVV